MNTKKIALVGLLRQASEIITHEAMATDLNTVAEALHLSSDEKFASLVNADALAKLASFETVSGADLPKDQTPDGEGVSQGTLQTAPEASGAKLESDQVPDLAVSLDTGMVQKSNGPVVTKSAAEVAGKWTPKAASLVLAKLAQDAGRPDAVKEAELPKEQIPDGNTSGEGTVKDTPENSGAVLPKEQMPEDSDVIETDMVARSNGPVDTMATKAAAEETEEVEEKSAAEEEEKEEAGEKEAGDETPEGESEKEATDGYTFAGVQMGASASVEPAQLEASDSDLNNLFN